MAVVLRRVSNGYTYAGETDLTIMTCSSCGITYAIPSRLQEHAKSRGNRELTWYCPNGHNLGYDGQSDAEKERAARIRAEQRATAERDLREHTEHRLRAQKGATTRAKKRHAAGVCPCCNRTFSQLVRHMETQHPDYKPGR